MGRRERSAKGARRPGQQGPSTFYELFSGKRSRLRLSRQTSHARRGPAGSLAEENGRPRRTTVAQEAAQPTAIGHSRSEKPGEMAGSAERSEGRVDTAVSHPYILLFDPTATPAACPGRRRLSRPVPPPMFIRRDGIVSTGFPGQNALWEESVRGAEGVVESGSVGFGRFVSFFVRCGLAGFRGASLRPTARFATARAAWWLVWLGWCFRFDRPVSVE